MLMNTFIKHFSINFESNSDSNEYRNRSLLKLIYNTYMQGRKVKFRALEKYFKSVQYFSEKKL